ncbi:MAG: hypothetical protein ABIP46_08335 [Polaromonas sp.]
MHYLLHEKFTMPSHVRANQFQFGAELPQFSSAGFATAFFARVVLPGVVALSSFMLPAAAAQNTPSMTMSEPGAGLSDNTVVPVKIANFGQEASSPESRKLADWVMDSADNGKMPFIIVDKVQAQVFVFDAQGQIRGASSALLGLAVGDDSVPGIGQRKLSSIRPSERTTPAGRFVASLARDIHGQEILWVDYDTAVSLHPVVKGLPKERRAERLASPSPLDRRISFGCINVPVKFYEKVVSPLFTGTNGIVYVLPETRSAREVFGSYDVQDASRKQSSAGSAQASNSAAR